MKKGDTYFLKAAFGSIPIGAQVTIRAYNDSHAAVILANGKERVVPLSKLSKKEKVKGHPLTKVFK